MIYVSGGIIGKRPGSHERPGSTVNLTFHRQVVDASCPDAAPGILLSELKRQYRLETAEWRTEPVVEETE